MTGNSAACERFPDMVKRSHNIETYLVREHPLSTYAPRGREGGSKKLENMRTIVLIGCVKSVQEGGRGSKKQENLRTYFMDAP